jgi:hypothetical protein
MSDGRDSEVLFHADPTESAVEASIVAWKDLSRYGGGDEGGTGAQAQG